MPFFSPFFSILVVEARQIDGNDANLSNDTVRYVILEIVELLMGANFLSSRVPEVVLYDFGSLVFAVAASDTGGSCEMFFRIESFDLTLAPRSVSTLFEAMILRIIDGELRPSS